MVGALRPLRSLSGIFAGFGKLPFDEFAANNALTVKKDHNHSRVIPDS